jgi:glucose-6-phosphate 1-dehydrogenase
MNYEGRILYYNEHGIVHDFIANHYTNNDAYVWYDSINYFINN